MTNDKLNPAEPADRERLLAACLDVYAFTLEFVLLCGDKEPVVQSQIKAAREAYRAATGESPDEVFRSRVG